MAAVHTLLGCCAAAAAHLHQHVRPAAGSLGVEEEAVGRGRAFPGSGKVGHVGLANVPCEILCREGGSEEEFQRQAPAATNPGRTLGLAPPSAHSQPYTLPDGCASLSAAARRIAHGSSRSPGTRLPPRLRRPRATAQLGS